MVVYGVTLTCSIKSLPLSLISIFWKLEKKDALEQKVHKNEEKGPKKTWNSMKESNGTPKICIKVNIKKLCICKWAMLYVLDFEYPIRYLDNVSSCDWVSLYI